MLFTSRAIPTLLLLVFCHTKDNRSLHQISQENRVQWAQGFSGDFVYFDLAQPKSNRHGRIYANILGRPRGLRQDTVYPDKREISSIWRQDRITSVSIDHAQRVFWETSNEQRVRPNIVGSLTIPEFMGKSISNRLVGLESIEGRAVEHWKVIARGHLGSDAEWDYWVDERLHVCIKAVVRGQKEYKLSKIVEGRQPRSLFTVPAGFREIPKPDDIPTP